MMCSQSVPIYYTKIIYYLCLHKNFDCPFLYGLGDSKPMGLLHKIPLRSALVDRHGSFVGLPLGAVLVITAKAIEANPTFKACRSTRRRETNTLPLGFQNCKPQLDGHLGPKGAGLWVLTIPKCPRSRGKNLKF